MSDNGPPEDSGLPEAVVARQVRKWRLRRGLSPQQLADRIQRLGGKLGRRTITKIETDDRGVSLNDLMLLAYALAVSPTLLLVPFDDEESIEIFPGIEVSCESAREWIGGSAPPPSRGGHDAELSREWSEPARILGRYDDATRARRQFEARNVAHTVAKASGNQKRISATLAARANAMQEFADALNALVREGLRVPPQAAEHIGPLKELGLLEQPEAIPVLPTKEQ